MSGDEWVAVIIEDDPDVRDLIDIVLTQSGFRTVVTSNGPEGVEAVRAHNPLITTLDVNMPGMDGFAVAKRLREFSSTYLIMITALADEIDVVQGFEAGADDYLVKPFRPRELRARADSMLRRPRSRTEAPVGREGGADEGPRPVEAPPLQRPVEPTPLQLPVEPTPLQVSSSAPPARPEPSHPPVEATPLQAQHAAATPPAGTSTAQPDAVPGPRPAPQHVAVAPASGSARADGPWLRFNGLALNSESRDVTVDGGAVDLSRAEFDLLASLLTTGRRVRSKADLVLTMRGQQYVSSYFVNEDDKRSVEAHIANLSRKLGDDEQAPRYVEAVSGVGYRLAEAS